MDNNSRVLVRLSMFTEYGIDQKFKKRVTTGSQKFELISWKYHLVSWKCDLVSWNCGPVVLGILMGDLVSWNCDQAFLKCDPISWKRSFLGETRSSIVKTSHIFGNQFTFLKLGHIFRKPGHIFRKPGHIFRTQGHLLEFLIPPYY